MGRHLQLFTGEEEQQLKAVGIGVAGMHARPSLGKQVILQESRDMRRNRGHGAPRFSKTSQASAMSSIKWGVACRYQ